MEKKVKRMLIESKGDDDSAGEKDTKVIGKAEEMDGPSKNIGKKGQEKAKIYNERKGIHYLLKPSALIYK